MSVRAVCRSFHRSGSQAESSLMGADGKIHQELGEIQLRVYIVPAAGA